MTGGVIAFTPGEDIPVYIQEDGNGDLPTRSDFVTIVDETPDYTVVQLAGDGDIAIGQLEAYDHHDDSGDPVAGSGTIVSGKLITYAPVADAYDPSVGDEVEEAADGVVAFDGAADPETPYGQVFSTVARNFGVGGKVAVANYR